MFSRSTRKRVLRCDVTSYGLQHDHDEMNGEVESSAASCEDGVRVQRRWRVMVGHGKFCSLDISDDCEAGLVTREMMEIGEEGKSNTRNSFDCVIYQSAIEGCHGNYVYADPSNSLCTNSLQRMNECIGDINLSNTLEAFCALVNPDPTCPEATQIFSEFWANNKDVQKALSIREIDRAAGGKLRNKNTDESWEIIENLTLYDHEGWDETEEFVKPVKAISTPQGVQKTPDRRLLELENTFAFRERTGPSPQPQALETTFEARVRDYMATHTERMERFENTIFKQREEINGRITKMFGLLKELTTRRTPEKVLIREEVKFPVTKSINSISLTKGEEERSNRTPDNTKKLTKTKMEMQTKEVEKINEVENGAGNKSIKISEAVEAPAGKKKGKEYKILPGGPTYDAILKKKITRKEDIGGNFEIPCSIGDLKRVNALVDQGSDVNDMPYSTYMRLTDERPTETYIRLSLASHSYIYPLGIAEDVLVEATIKFDIGTITRRSGKSKVSFHRISDYSCITDKGVKNNIEPIAPIMTVNWLVLEWEEMIKLHLEKEMKFNQWRHNNFKNKQPDPVKVEGGMDDEGEVT
ncbi:MAK10-like protein [Tanacetum coccineum]